MALHTTAPVSSYTASGRSLAGTGNHSSGVAAGCFSCTRSSEACFDEGETQEERWNHVGAGRGGYEKSPQYIYTGEGVGDYDQEVQASLGNSCSRIPTCCIGTCAVLMFATALFIGYAALTRGKDVSNNGDLESDVAAAEDRSDNVGSGNAGTVITARYDCEAGFSNWQNGWSAIKKGWCCKHHQRGCPPSSSDPFDCDDHLETQWLKKKQHWCCEKYDRGCPGTDRFDCEAGFGNWQQAWRPDQQQWCCTHLGRACTQEQTVRSTTAPEQTVSTTSFDCLAGFSNWMAGWSEPKKQWCCKTVSRGCTMLPGPAPKISPVPTVTAAARAPQDHDCSNGWPDVAAWPNEKRRWCCTMFARGCSMVGA